MKGVRHGAIFRMNSGKLDSAPSVCAVSTFHLNHLPVPFSFPIVILSEGWGLSLFCLVLGFKLCLNVACYPGPSDRISFDLFSLSRTLQT